LGRPRRRAAADWPKPAKGEKVFLVLEGQIEATVVGDLLVALGASVTRARLKDAMAIASAAANFGHPFTSLLADRTSVEAGATRLLPLLKGSGHAPHAVVIVDPAERNDIPRLREEGFDAYLFAQCGRCRF
jgi:hypothetical protein